MTTGLRVLAVAALLAMPLVLLATPASGATSTTGVLNSFDGTPIVYTLFLPDGASATSPAPAVLYTHGWAGSRATTNTGLVKAMTDQGLAVLTWDARGFGASGGFIELDSPAYEVRDTIALIDMLATNPAIQQDAAGDPRVGMTGSSYAGGIQLLTAAFDQRIDAITPDITWNDLRESLGPGGVPKEAWIQVLFASGAALGTSGGLAGGEARSYDINLPLWYAEVHATNGMTSDVWEGLRERSPSQYIAKIHAPTLFTQGLPDTLFNPNQAMATYGSLLANGVPSRMVLGCFGHSGCPYVADDAGVQAETVGWLTHYLQGVGSAGPAVKWFDNAGVWHAGDAWPPTGAAWKHANGVLRLASTPAPTGGGGFAIGAGGVNGATPALPRDDGAGSANVAIATAGASGLDVAGIGRVHLSVTGVGSEAFLFFRLVDATSGAVIDGQTQAWRMPISPVSSSVADVDLIGVGYHVPAGHTLALQVSTSDVAHATNRQPGTYDIALTVDVPTVV